MFPKSVWGELGVAGTLLALRVPSFADPEAFSSSIVVPSLSREPSLRSLCLSAWSISLCVIPVYLKREPHERNPPPDMVFEDEELGNLKIKQVCIRFEVD